MIASHGTFTYLPPKHWWQRIFHFTSKSQHQTIAAQYAAGVRFFDLRLSCTKEEICFSHGDVEYAMDYTLPKLFQTYKDCGFRIILEHGDMEIFKWHVRYLLDHFASQIREVIIDKTTWEVFCYGKYPIMPDICCYSRTTRHWWQFDIRWPWLENKQCQKPTKEHIDDPQRLYWFDFITYERYY